MVSAEKPLLAPPICSRMGHERGRLCPAARQNHRSSNGKESRRSVNALDIIVIAVVALSALFAFARGFVKESLSIAAWVGAGLITLYGLPHLRPVALKYISNPLLAAGAAGVTLFVVSLIVLSLLTSAVAGRVKQSALSAVDPSLGLLVRALRRRGLARLRLPLPCTASP